MVSIRAVGISCMSIWIYRKSIHFF